MHLELYHFDTKQFLFLLFIIISITGNIFVLFNYQKSKHSKIKNCTVPDYIKKLDPELKCKLPENQKCQPRKFVFLKNHKAGSSSMRLLLMNFQARNNWNMTLPVNGDGPFLGGWPGPFNSRFYSGIPKTDIIYDHLRWDWKEIKKVLKPPVNHVKIAIVREPISLLKSSFNFFYARFNGNYFIKNKNLRTNRSSCIGSMVMACICVCIFPLVMHMHFAYLFFSG